MIFNLSCLYLISCITLLYNKEALSRTLCSLFASASHVTAIGAETALHKFLIQPAIFIIIFLFEYFWFMEKSSAIIYLQKQNFQLASTYEK